MRSMQLYQQSREVPTKRTTSSRNRHKRITSSTIMPPGMKYPREFRQRFADGILATCLSR